MRRWMLVSTVIAAFFTAAMFTGCADPEVMAEVLQLKDGQQVYTRYNIWYRNPAEISCLNIQEGSFLPVGSRIEPVGTSSNEITGRNTITFKDLAGQLYTIEFDPGYRLCSMRDFIEETFTTTPPDEMFKDISPQIQERIRQGQVVPGMSRREVLLAYGPPPAVRTPSLRNESWIYWITPSRSLRLVFRGDKVRNILGDSE